MCVLVLISETDLCNVLQALLLELCFALQEGCEHVLWQAQLEQQQLACWLGQEQRSSRACEACVLPGTAQFFGSGNNDGSSTMLV